MRDPATMLQPRSDDGDTAGARPCPLCGAPLYGWIVLQRGAPVGVGMAIERPDEAERVVVRCENCGLALDRDAEPDLGGEWGAITGGARAGAIALPNRASLQAGIGVEGWAAIDESPGSMLLTPKSLALLAERCDQRIGRVRTPASRRAQAWMWQTLLNGLTFHPNFAREVRAGRLRPSSARSRSAFAIDALVSALGAALVLIVSVPLELCAAAVRRGGEMTAEVERG